VGNDRPRWRPGKRRSWDGPKKAWPPPAGAFVALKPPQKASSSPRLQHAAERNGGHPGSRSAAIGRGDATAPVGPSVTRTAPGSAAPRRGLRLSPRLKVALGAQDKAPHHSEFRERGAAYRANNPERQAGEGMGGRAPMGGDQSSIWARSHHSPWAVVTAEALPGDPQALQSFAQKRSPLIGSPEWASFILLCY